MKVLIILAIACAALAQDDSCPAWNDWRDWTDQCLWFADDGKLTLKTMRQEMTTACGLDFDVSQLPDPLAVSDVTDMPDRCGYCSMKARCRTRTPADECFPLEMEGQKCEAHGDICEMPKTPIYNDCMWNYMMEHLKQCPLRPDLPEWKREAYNKFAQMAPEINCKEDGDKCKCCCHPYKPSDDLQNCVKVEEPKNCGEFGEYNDWSECLWYPMESIKEKFQEHCSLPTPQGAPEPGEVAVPTPPGFEIPEKCGYCSFKVRCRKRDGAKKPACFPVEAEKQLCGPDDCETCGDVCELPTLPEKEGEKDKCYWHSLIVGTMKARAVPVFNKIKSYWKKRGLLNLLKNVPMGKCIEIEDKCKCCCHPYEPNEDGTACVVKDYCKTPEEHGMDWTSIVGGESKRK